THPDSWALMGALMLAYLFAVRGGEASSRQIFLFSSGVFTLLVASDWPIHALAERFLGWPIPNLIQFNRIVVLSHWPLIVNGTLEDHPLHFVAHAVLVISAVIMWLPIVSPLPEIPQAKPPTKMLYLFLQGIVPTVPASFLTFGTTPLYHFYEHVPRLWGMSALEDMQIAGLTMKIVGSFYLWTIIGVIFFRWYAAEERTSGEVLYWEDVENELKLLGPLGNGNSNGHRNGNGNGNGNGKPRHSRRGRRTP